MYEQAENKLKSLRKIAFAGLLLTVSTWVVAGAAGSALARMLPFHHCLKLESEKASLVSQGAQANLENGPAWGKVTLPSDKIQQVRRLIAVEEALLFRCDMRRMKALKKRMSLPKFAKWKALKPPLPSRNPKFVALRRR